MTTKSQNGLLSRHELGTQIVSLTNKVVSLEEAVQRVRELHAYDPDAICTSCNYLHPCPTIQALDGEQ